MYAAIIRLMKKETIEIDCYGDSARVAEYKSVFFEEEVDDDDDDSSDDEAVDSKDTDSEKE